MLNHQLKLTNICAIISLVFLGYACGSSEDEHRVENIDSTTIKNIKKDTTDVTEGIKKVAADFPSPVDFVSHINQAELEYNDKYLNSTGNVNNYLTNSAQTALNLGVYMADLGYSSLYFKAQESLSYLKVTKRLSDQLGILNDRSKKFVDRFENNLDNRDSLLTITREAYFSIDEYLKGSERRDIASLILTGSWVEGLYVTCNLVRNIPDLEQQEKLKPVLWRIGGQKRSLNNLIMILGKQEPNEVTSKLLVKLKSLQKIYENVKIVEDDASKEHEIIDIAEIKDVDEITDKTVLRSITKVDISVGTLQEIATSVNDIRNFIITK